MKPPEPVPLAVQRDDLRGRLAERLAAQAPLPELSDLHTRLQWIDEALAASSRPRPVWHRHLAALVAVAALVSLAALWPMPQVSFALELEAGAVQLQMGAAGSLAGDKLDGHLRVEGFDRLESADAALVQRSQEAAATQLGLQADQLRLRRLRYPTGARLEFEGGTGSVRLAVDGAPHAVEIDVGGQVTFTLPGALREQRRYGVAEWITLVSANAPSELWLGRAPSHSFVWRGLQPNSLRMVERQAGADGQSRVVSSLQKGVLRIPATGSELRLLPGSGVELDGLRVEQAELSLGERATLKLSGSAQRLVVETGGFQRSMRPSLLEYAAHNHTVSLLWSAAGLLWGISTWLRKAFGEKA